MMGFLETAFFFVLALSILIVVHEWGHYWVARRAGVRVLRFSIGFGPEIVGRTRGDTRWSICAIPFGGYVKFAGDNPEEDREEAPDEFLSQPVGVRSAIVLAGPAMNYVLAIVVFAAVIWAQGVPLSPAPRVGEVQEGTIAEAMGIRPDDVVVSVEGTPVSNGTDVRAALSVIEAGSPFRLEVSRDGRLVPLTGTAPADGGFARELLGIAFFQEPLVGAVKRGSPAWNAGLREGDRIVEVDGEPTDRWSRVEEMIRARPGLEVPLAYERGGQVTRVTVVPEEAKLVTADGEQTVGLIQIGPRMERESVGPVAALASGWSEAWGLTKTVVLLIPQLPVKIFDYYVRGEDDGGFGGPILIAQVLGQAARWGFLSFLWLLAAISTQLAIFNLLPIPVLDGGHMALYTVEAITRRPPSLRVRVVLQQIGFAILLLLMVSVIVMDTGRILG